MNTQGATRTTAWIAAGWSLASALYSPPALAGQQLAPRVTSSDTYAENFTFVADLADGGYAWAQLSVSNIGPGSGNAACRAMVVRPGRKAWTAMQRFDRDEWRHDPASDTLVVGPCSASSGAQTSVRVPLDGGLVELRYSASISPQNPHAAIAVGGDRHATTLLLPFAQLAATVQLPGATPVSASGGGYADHSRSTVPPRQLAKRWVRFRALRGPTKLLLLTREDQQGRLEPAWLQPQGKALQRVDRQTVQRGGSKKAPMWSIELVSGDRKYTLVSKTLLVRSAPLEDLSAVLAAVLRPIFGSPVTFVHRATLQVEGEAEIPGILEVSEEG
jgi:hypothetical protein